MPELPRQSYVTVRYYAPWLTLAFAGGGFSSAALGRAALGEEETR